MTEKEGKSMDMMDTMGDDMDGGDEGGGPRTLGGRFQRKKADRFAADPEYVLDYKNIRVMKSFITEHGKIIPRRITGLTAYNQRKLTRLIKRARHLALIGYVSLD